MDFRKGGGGMKRQFAHLLAIEQDQAIRKDTNSEAWHHLQQGLLLALRDSGTLSATQYRLALEDLKAARGRKAKG